MRYLYVRDQKKLIPGFEFPVFAIYSSYMETRFFTMVSTNFADELIILLFLAGLSILVFLKEKNETDYLKK